MKLPDETLAKILEMAEAECDRLTMFDGVPTCERNFLPCGVRIKAGKCIWLNEMMRGEADATD